MSSVRQVFSVVKCGCQTPGAHAKFYKNGHPLIPFGIFSVEEGTEALDEMIMGGLVDPAARDHLLAELRASGVPETHREAEEAEEKRRREEDLKQVRGMDDELKVARGAEVFSSLSAKALDEALSEGVRLNLLTAACAGLIRARIAAMSDEDKVRNAIRLYQRYKDGEELRKHIAENSEPALLERIQEGLRKAWAEDPFAGFAGEIVVIAV